jgi:NDP-sugar pyrophosphorylase family protein
MPSDPQMRAVIMAGGRGSRLAPYTAVLPKPLMPLSDRPILDVVLSQLGRQGVTSISISVGHMGSLIETWVRHQADYGLPIEFVYEDHPLGTAGALANVERPESTFLALNGDILTDLPFARLAEHNARHGAIATMAVKERVVNVQYGVVHAHDDGRVERLEEKPQLAYTVSMGVYAMEPQIIDLIEPGERIDFPDLILRAIEHGHDVQTYRHADYWRDIGNREDYEAAIEDFATRAEAFIGSDGAAR